MANLTEREFTRTLIAAMNGIGSLGDEEVGDLLDLTEGEEEAATVQSLRGMEAASFRQEGVMSSNEGLTVRLPSGRTFQLTVVRSR